MMLPTARYYTGSTPVYNIIMIYVGIFVIYVHRLNLTSN